MPIDFSCNYGLGSIILSPYSKSSGIYTYSSSNPIVASFANDLSDVLYINNVGNTTLTITQGATRNYLTNYITANLTVNPNKNNKVNFDIPTIEYIDTSLDLSLYTRNIISTGEITYYVINATNPNIATINSNFITFNASAGTFQIQMVQSSDQNYSSITILSSVITVPPRAYLDFNLPVVEYKDTSFNLMNYITYKNITAYIKFQLLDTNNIIIDGNASSIASIDSYNNIYFYNQGDIKVKAYIDACSNYLEKYSSNSETISVNVYGPATLSVKNIPTAYIGTTLTLNTEPVNNPYIDTNNTTSSIIYKVLTKGSSVLSSSIATFYNNIITYNGSGTITVIASIPNSGTYSAVSTPFDIIIYPRANLVYNGPTAVFDTNSKTLSNYIASDSTGAIIYSILTGSNYATLYNSATGDISFSNTSTTDNGTATIKFYQSASGSYSSATITKTITIYKRTNVYFSDDINNQPYKNDLSFILRNYTRTESSGNLNYKIISDTNGISSLTNPTNIGNLAINKSGTMKLYVYQDASGIYSANDSSINIIINPGTISFVNTNSISKTYGDSTFNIGININDSNSGLTVSDGIKSYTSSNTSVCTIDSTGNITIVGAGQGIFTVFYSNPTKYNSNSININMNIAAAASPSIDKFTFTVSDVSYQYGRFVSINNPTTSLVGSSDFVYSYSTTSTDISINEINVNSYQYKMIHARSSIPITAKLISCNNYTPGIEIPITFNINKANAPPDGSFSFPISDVSYAYGSSFILPAPTTPDIPSSSDFTYTYSTMKPIDICLNRLSDGSCKVFVKQADTNIDITARLDSANDYIVGTTKTTTFQIDKANAPPDGSFSFPISDVSYTGGTFYVAAPTTTVLGTTDFSYTYETTTPNLISVSKSTDGSCIVVESTTSNSVGIATITATLGSSFTNYNGGTQITKSFNIDKGYMPTSSVFSVSTISDLSFTKGGSFIIYPPAPINLSGSSDFSFNYTTTSSDICLNLIGNNQCDVSLVQTGTNEQIVAVLTKSSNYVVGTQIPYNPFTIRKGNMPPTSNFTFSISDVSYQYGGSFIINPPTTTLPGYFTYTYTNLYSNPAITLVGSNIDINTAGNSIAVQARVSDSKNYIAGTDVSTTFIIRKLAAPLPSDFTFTQVDVSYTGGTYTIAAPTTTLPGSSDFSFNYTALSQNISVSKSLYGSCVLTESTAINSVGPARLNSTLGTPINYVGGTIIDLSYTIDKGHQPRRSDLSGKIIPDTAYSLGGTIDLFPPTTSLSGASDFSYNYSIVSDPSDGINNIIDVSNHGIVYMKQLASNIRLKTTLIRSSNYDVSGTGSYTDYSFNSFNIVKDSTFQILASDFSFVIPTTTTYQYGSPYVLSAPILSTSGRSRLGGSFNFTYSVFGTSPSINDISVNLDANGLDCDMSINKIGTVPIDTSATVFINATLAGSSLYNLPTTIPVVKSTGIKIVKKPINDNGTFTFNIADVSYTGGTFTVPGPTTTLPGSDFSYNYVVVSGPITVSTAADGSCIIQHNNQVNAVGSGNVVAKINSSMRYDISGFNNRNLLSKSFNINKGNSLAIPLSDVSWTPIPTKTYLYGGTFTLPNPTVRVAGASDMSFTFTTSSNAITINTNNKDVSINSASTISIDISATLSASTNYDISKPLKFSLNPFTINKAAAPAITFNALTAQTAPTSGTSNYDFADATISSSDPNANASFTYSSGTTSVASIDNSSVSVATIKASGTSTIIATYSGNDYYTGGSTASQTLTVQGYTNGLDYKTYNNNSTDQSTSSNIYFNWRSFSNVNNSVTNCLTFFTTPSKSITKTSTTTIINSCFTIFDDAAILNVAATFYGYFKPSISSKYTFVLGNGRSTNTYTCDDIGVLWFGNTAGQSITDFKSNLTESNYSCVSTIYSTGINNKYHLYTTNDLNANSYYPLVFNYGQGNGNVPQIFLGFQAGEINTLNNNFIFDGTGYFYHQ
jgi:hypothetical protein